MATHWQETSAGGQAFRYLDTGEGPLVVLLHGFPDLPQSWDSIRARLNAAGYRTVVPYLRGFHRSTLSERGFSAAEQADDVALLLDALGESAAVVVGHDFGAGITCGAATKHPDRVSKMVAVGIPHIQALRPSLRAAWDGRHFAYFKLPWAESAVRRSPHRVVDTLYRRWSPSWDGPEREASVAAVVEALQEPAVVHGALAYYKALNPLDPLFRPKITMPALVVGGSDDPVIVQEAFARTPDYFAAPCDVRILGGAGHWPHREAEDDFVEALLAFLAR